MGSTNVLVKLNLDALAKAHPAIALFLSRSKLTYDPMCPSAGTGVTPDGQLVTYIGTAVANAAIPVQVEVLKHELAHVIGRFWNRLNTLDPQNTQLFNIAHDAAIHEAGCCDWQMVDTELKTQCVTCERLNVEPMPAEDIYYELLKNPEQHNIQFVSCGRGDFLEKKHQAGQIQDPNGNAVDKQLSEAIQSALGNQIYAGQSHATRTLAGTLPPTPAWAQKLYRYLEEFKGDDRYPERSWQRGASRRYELLPSWPRVQPSHSALLFLDASGSMGDDILLQAVAAAQAVGLSVKARVWSTHVSEELPPDPASLRAEIQRHGGGTNAVASAKVIQHERCVIWISDAESADGLPPERKGWIWVVTQNNKEPRFTRHPSLRG